MKVWVKEKKELEGGERKKPHSEMRGMEGRAETQESDPLFICHCIVICNNDHNDHGSSYGPMVLSNLITHKTFFASQVRQVTLFLFNSGRSGAFDL